MLSESFDFLGEDSRNECPPRGGPASPPRPGSGEALRAIAAELAAIGHLLPRPDGYHASSIRHLLAG